MALECDYMENFQRRWIVRNLEFMLAEQLQKHMLSLFFQSKQRGQIIPVNVIFKDLIRIRMNPCFYFKIWAALQSCPLTLSISVQSKLQRAWRLVSQVRWVMLLQLSWWDKPLFVSNWTLIGWHHVQNSQHGLRFLQPFFQSCNNFHASCHQWVVR